MGSPVITITPENAPVTITPDAEVNPYGSGTLVDNPIKGGFAKALSGAGLPTSIANIPEWFSNLKNLNISHLFVEPVRKAIENPTNENIARATPLFGPVGADMAASYREGKPVDALGSLLGFFGAIKGAGQIKPGASAIGQQAIDARGTISEIAKATKGHSLTATAIDKLLPEPKPVDFKGGAYSDFEGESGKPVPITKGPNYPTLLAAKKAAMEQAAADAANPAGKPLVPGGKIVDPNSAPRPINTTYVNYPRLRLVSMANRGDVAALRELERNPGGIDIETAVPNAKFLLDSSKRVIYGGPTE